MDFKILNWTRQLQDLGLSNVEILELVLNCNDDDFLGEKKLTKIIKRLKKEGGLD